MLHFGVCMNLRHCRLFFFVWFLPIAHPSLKCSRDIVTLPQPFEKTVYRRVPRIEGRSLSATDCLPHFPFKLWKIPQPASCCW